MSNTNQRPPAPRRPDFKSLFIEANKTRQWLRVLYWGNYGTGKTRAALTFPNPAVISTDPGTLPYMGRLGGNVYYFPAANYEQVMEAIAAVRADNGETVQTLILDSITPIIDLLRAEYLTASRTGYLSESDHTRVNIKVKSLYNALNALPLHVVVTARQRDLYERNTERPKIIGVGVDADKSAGYQFNFVVKMTGIVGGKIGGFIENSKGLPNMDGQKPDITWAGCFADIAAALMGETDPNDLTQRLGASMFFSHWRAQGLTDAQILNALGVKRISEFKDGRAAADERLANLKSPASQPTQWSRESVTDAIEERGLGFGRDKLIKHPAHLGKLLVKLTREGKLNKAMSTDAVIAVITQRNEEPPPPPIDTGFGEV